MKKAGMYISCLNKTLKIVDDQNRIKEVDLDTTESIDDISMEIIDYFRPYREYIDEEFSSKKLGELIPELLESWDWNRPFEYTERDRKFTVWFYLLDK